MAAGIPSLFDDFERNDPSSGKWSEDTFSVLNRVATPYWGKIRTQLDAWFTDYAGTAAADKAADLRARFRSADARQHLPAWWELYIYWLLRRLHPTKSILVEPERVGQSARPDFAIANGEAGPIDFWVEATAMFSGTVEEGRHGAREAVVLDAINEIQSSDFRVMISSLSCWGRPAEGARDCATAGEVAQIT